MEKGDEFTKVKKAFKKIREDFEKNQNLLTFQSRQVERIIDELADLKKRITALEKERFKKDNN